jgi:signal transduction histidine kinase
LFHEIAFLFLVAVTGIVSGLSTWFWQQSSAESVRINNLIYLAEQIRGELFLQLQEVIRARLLEDMQALEVYAEYSREIDRDFNQLRQNAAAREEDLAIQAMQQSYREIQKDMNKIFGDPYSINYVVRIRILDPKFAEQMVDRFEDSYTDFKNLLGEKHERLDQTLRRWTYLAPVLIPASFLAALAIVLFTSRVIRREFVLPMATVKEGAGVISRGRLDHRIPEQGVNEVVEIAQSINRMAQDLAASRDALVQSEKQAALGALVPVVAHNIRNPLASIRATAQVLDDIRDPEELRESREAIIETIDRLGRWVNALVSYLHPLKPALRPVTAPALLEAALGVMRPRLQEKHISVQREGWDQDAEIAADPDLMEQALTGLLANAIEASPVDGVISVAVGRGAERLIIRISDSGAGIPFIPAPGDLEPGPSTKQFGTGLGIPVAYKICKSHGWDIDFKAGPAGGTEVTISAPLAAHGGAG